MRDTITEVSDERSSGRAVNPKVHLLQSIDKELSNKVESRFASKISDEKLSARTDNTKVHLLQSIDKELSNKVESRFTGKVIFVLNLSQGGIGQCSVQTDTRLS